MFKPAYTLIELLIIITISAILISAGVSAYSSSARRQAVKTAAEALLSAFQAAQKNSLIGKKTCSGALLGYQLSYTDGGSTLTSVDKCQTGDGISQTITLDKITFVGSNTILFRPLGQGVTVSGGGDTTTVTFRHLDTASNYQLVIDRSGTIKYLGTL